MNKARVAEAVRGTYPKWNRFSRKENHVDNSGDQKPEIRDRKFPKSEVRFPVSGFGDCFRP
jgi:hypothetical protein